MDNLIFYFKAEGDNLSLIEVKNTAYTGNINSYLCNYELSKDWAGLTAFAVFSSGETTVTSLLSEDNTCYIPYEVLQNNSQINIGLFATSASENNPKRLVTGFVPINIENGAYNEDIISAQTPSANMWELLINKNIPKIGDNGNWYIWDIEEQGYVDSGHTAVCDQINYIEGVQVSGSDLPVTNKKVNIDLSNYYTKSQSNALINAKYTKPQTGIPKTDLSQELQKNDDISTKIAMYGKNLTPNSDDNFIFTGSIQWDIRALNTSLAGDIVIPYGHLDNNVYLNVTRIGVEGFKNCENITSITMPKSIEAINRDAFVGCTGLTYVEIPESVKIIYSRAFKNCTNLTSIIISKHTVLSGSEVFAGCPNLTIYCDKGSIAETYCKDNNINYVYIETSAHKVNSITAQSTHDDYPSAKAVYDLIGNIPSRVTEITSVQITDLFTQTHSNFAERQEITTGLTGADLNEYDAVEFVWTNQGNGDMSPRLYYLVNEQKQYITPATPSALSKYQLLKKVGANYYFGYPIISNLSGNSYNMSAEQSNTANGRTDSFVYWVEIPDNAVIMIDSIVTTYSFSGAFYLKGVKYNA